MDAGTRKQLLVTGGRSRFGGASSLKSLGRGLSKRKITKLCIQNCAYRIVHTKLCIQNCAYKIRNRPWKRRLPRVGPET